MGLIDSEDNFSALEVLRQNLNATMEETMKQK